MDRKQAVRSNVRQTDIGRSKPRKRNRSPKRMQSDTSSTSRQRQPHASLRSAADVRSARPTPSLYLLLKLFRRHILLVWLVAAALLIGMATAAMMSIVDPRASAPPQTPQTGGFGSTTPLPGSVADSIAQPNNPASVPPQIPNSPPSLPSIQGSRLMPAALPSDSPMTKAMPPKPASPTEPVSPLSAGGMLLLSCAGGCFLLSQCLQPRAVRRKPLQQKTTLRSPSLASAEPTASANLLGENFLEVPNEAGQATQALPSQPALADRNCPTPIDSASQNSAVPPLPRSTHLSATSFSPAPANSPNSPHSAPRTTRAATPTLIQEPLGRLIDQALESVIPNPPVAVEAEVIPVEQTHPLDWDEPSLADSLDLRQRRSLSDWL
ncbi:MAG: hypothetical protein MUF72_03430 [Elainella sp. Prado103]|nr:hypothetical protein [Elainella sp. Prado103]